MKKVDILLPCYNEEKTIKKCINDIEKVISKDHNYEYQIILCDNNSNDKSRDIAKSLGIKVLIEKKKGYGNTILNGINNSKADYIVMLDSDTSYDEKDIPKFISYLKDYDFVIGNRFKGVIEKNAMPLTNRIGSQSLTFYANLFFHTPSHDYHCGLRAFKRKEILKCNLSTPGFEFASEMIIKAKINKLKIKEIPTNLYSVIASRKPHLKPFKDGLRHFNTINKLISKKKLIFLLITIFFLLYLLLLIYTSNYHTNNNIPILDIKLNNTITLDDINNNDKTIKYEKNKMTINNDKYNNITIKGRGHNTWKLIKRPYQISFNKKTSILELPSSTKYVLLANYLDPSLLKNDFTYSVAKKMELGYSNTGTFIDLYIDKKYLGNYYIIPKISINSSSVDLKNDNSILIELNNLYYEEEDYYFQTKYFKDYLTIKDRTNKNNNESYITFQNKYNLVEKNIKKKNYNWLKKNIDIESFIKNYIIIDFAANDDSYQSSTFFYMDGLEDKIHMGPIWDFDLAYGAYEDDQIANNHFKIRPTRLFEELLKIEEFKKDVSTYWRTSACKIYKEEINNLDNKIDKLNKSGEKNSMYWNDNHYNYYTKEFKNWVIDRYDYYNKEYGCDES